MAMSDLPRNGRFTAFALGLFMLGISSGSGWMAVQVIEMKGDVREIKATLDKGNHYVDRDIERLRERISRLERVVRPTPY